MSTSLIHLAILLAASVLWVTGLRIFLRSGLSRRRKTTWSAFLVLVGLGIGVVLPLRQVWNKFLLVLAILPVLVAVDVLLLGSRRGWSFWIRACGFEVCTVFAVAGGVRLVLDLAGAGPLLVHAD